MEAKKGQVNGTATAGLGLGLRVVGGADYYFLDNVYMGVEFGWGYMFNTVADTEIELTDKTTNTTDKFKVAGGSNNGFTPSVNAGIRLGFIF